MGIFHPNSNDVGVRSEGEVGGGGAGTPLTLNLDFLITGGQLFFHGGHMRNRKYCGGPGQKA